MATDDETSPNAEEALRRYEQQRRTTRVRGIVSYTAVIVFGAFLLLFLAGDYTQDFFSWLGIRPIVNQKTGLYADCSRPENQSNNFCDGTPSADQGQWRRIEKRNMRPFGIP